MTLSPNIGSADRAARFVLGIVLVALAATGTLGVWAWIGIVPLATAVFRICPAYWLFGIRTCGAS